MSSISPESATDQMMREHRRALTLNRLARFPETRVETVAAHYAHMAATAAHLLHILKMRQRIGRSELRECEGVDEAIQYLYKQLLDAHANDLGLELGWPDWRCLGPMQGEKP